jgi:hypothetical protein
MKVNVHTPNYNSHMLLYVAKKHNLILKEFEKAECKLTFDLCAILRFSVVWFMTSGALSTPCLQTNVNPTVTFFSPCADSYCCLPFHRHLGARRAVTALRIRRGCQQNCTL